MIEKLKDTYPALTYRNFRYYWYGQCISLIGTWMQATAQQWLVYTITKSALLLGLLGAAQFGPIMFLSLFAGVVIDRYPKRKLLIFTQIAFTIQAIILTLLVWTGHITFWNVLILAVIYGLVNTLDQPARQSILPELVERKDLRSAIGLNSAVFNVARMIGPALAALLMAKYGAGPLFFLNAITFIPVIIWLYLMKLKPQQAKKVETKVINDILEGLKYIRLSPYLRSAILSTLVVGTFVMNFNVTIPLYAAEVLNQGVNGYGFLLSALGAGSFIGAFLVASWAKGHPKLSLLFGSAFAVSVLLMVIEPIHIMPLAIAMFLIIGFFNILFMTTANSTLQINSSDEFRGRVMSVYSFAFLGTTPIGNLFVGSVMQKMGAGMGILVCGAVSSVLMVLIVLNSIMKKRTHELIEKIS